ncbi:MAG TPA: CU044_5270 family protein [Actinocatenispora sp.]
MDEMDTVARLRADLPDPDPDVLTDARTQLLRRMSATPPKRRFGWRPVLARRLAIGVATAAAVAVGAGVVVAVTDGPAGPSHGRPDAASPASLPADAASALTLAADHTTRTGDPVVGAGQYTHVTQDLWQGEYVAGVSFLARMRMEVWVPASSGGVWWWRETDGLGTRFDRAADERKVRAAHPDFFRRKVSVSSGHDGAQDRAPAGQPRPAGNSGTGWAFPTPAFLARQPRDPKKLLAAIEAAQEDSSRTKADLPTLAFLSIAQTMSSGFVPADLRAALYRAARLVPGITLESTASDINGRKGISIGRLLPYGYLRQEILFDPKTGQFLGERQVVVRSTYDDAHRPVGSAYASTAVTVDVTGNPHLF